MKYGCNVSEELFEILDEQESFCDYIKIGAFGNTLPLLSRANNYKPLLLHGFGWFERGGMKDTGEMKFDFMNQLIKAYEVPHIGMHAMAYEKDMEHIFDAMSHMETIFTEVRNQMNVPLLIENMDYSPHYDYDVTTAETVEPDFINMLCHSGDFGFLLDTAHAKVSAYQLGMDIYEYLDRLPLEKTVEIHVSGCEYIEEEGYKDAHDLLSEDDFSMIAYVADHPRIAQNLKVVTLEYGTIQKDRPVDVDIKKGIINQMNRLKAIFDKVD